MNTPIFKFENGYGTIKLDNPGLHNALRVRDIDEIILKLEEWKKVKDLRALIITGNGESFCSGMFIEDLEKKNWQQNPVKRVCDSIESFSGVTICALNGSAYGAGVELAASCDFRVAHTKILIGIPAASLGIHYEPSGINRVLNLFGPRETRKIFLLDEKLNYKCLKNTSFIDYWVDDPSLVFRRALGITKKVSELSPLAVQGMKRSIVKILNNRENNTGTIDKFSSSLNSADHLEALRALRERRKAKFKEQ